MSYITPQSHELVTILSSARHAFQASGAALYGPDLSRWPAPMVDALVTLEIERNATENAAYQADKDNND